MIGEGVRGREVRHGIHVGGPKCDVWMCPVVVGMSQCNATHPPPHPALSLQCDPEAY